MFVELVKDYLGHAAGKQMQVEDTVGRSLAQAGVAKEIADPTTDLVGKAVGDAVNTLSTSLQKAVNEALKDFADAQAKSRRGAVPAIFGQDGAGDPRHNFGDWLVKVARNDRAALERDYGSTFQPWQKAALGETSGVTGGYVVPPEFYDALLQIMEEETFIRPRAFVQPMASATLMFPFLDITTVQSAGVSPFFGGVLASWTEEAQSRTETESQFKMMELKAHELSGYSVSSNVLLQDAAFGLEKFLMLLFGRAVAWFEEYAFLQGNGVGKPLGMLACNAAILTGGNAGGTGRLGAGLVQYQDLATMLSKLLPRSYKTAVWTVSPSVVPQLLQLKDGANRAIFISIDQGAVKAPQWQLLGNPVFITEKVPALGTKGDVSLLDPQLYVIGDRMMLEVAASEHVNFLKRKYALPVSYPLRKWAVSRLTAAPGRFPYPRPRNAPVAIVGVGKGIPGECRHTAPVHSRRPSCRGTHCLSPCTVVGLSGGASSRCRYRSG